MARKYDGKTRWVPMHASLALGALGARVATSGAAMNASADTYRLIGFKGTVSIEDLTGAEGPVVIGMADGDYTSTEIEECLEAVNSINLGDKIAREQANRLVRQFDTLDLTRSHTDEIWVKLNWLVSIGDQPKIYGYNADPDDPLTTGATVHLDGKVLVRFA